MTRTLDADILTELPKGQIQIALLVALDFSGGFVRVWSGIGNLTYDGNVYAGVGHLGEIAPIQESAGVVRANGITLRLSGIPSALLSVAFSQNYQGRSAKVWLAFFDTAWVLIDCALLFAGRMDTMTIEEGPETSAIILSAESHLADLKRPRVRRYTNEDQLAAYPGDLGLMYIEAMQNAEILWGPGSGGGAMSQPPVISSGVGGGGGSVGGGWFSGGGGGDGDPGGGTTGGGQTGSGQGGEGTGGSGAGGSGVA